MYNNIIIKSSNYENGCKYDYYEMEITESDTKVNKMLISGLKNMLVYSFDFTSDTDFYNFIDGISEKMEVKIEKVNYEYDDDPSIYNMNANFQINTTDYGQISTNGEKNSLFFKVISQNQISLDKYDSVFVEVLKYVNSKRLGINRYV